MPRDLRPALLAAALSLGVHVALGWVLFRLPPPSASSLNASPVAIEVRPGRAGAGRTDAQGRRLTDERPELALGGPTARQPLDGARRGQGGEVTGGRSVIRLLPRADAITLQDSPLNARRKAQTQRIRTARDRASWERRRATPNPSDAPFLASGSGPHRERRPVAREDARRGARRAPDAAQQGAARASEAGRARQQGPGPGGHAPATAALGDGEPAAGGAASRPGRAEPSPGRGIARGQGRRASAAARVAHDRPPVDDGPAATVADQPGRVRDNRDAELLAARMVQSFVEATQADGRAEGRGTGGSGHGGKPGSGGTSGAGGRSTSHQPGPGRYPALDTGDHRYRTWYNSQRRRIERALVFPRERQLAMDQGTAVYRLTVRRNGTLADAPRLLRRSGHADLDRAALAAIRESVPFDPIPPDLAPSYEAIRVTLALQFSNPMVR